MITGHPSGFSEAPDLVTLSKAPATQLGKWPTPIERYQWKQADILVKRDDLSGYGRGGVKTRKIENLIDYMVSNGYDELITGIANVTNLAHDILPALEARGIQSQLFVINNPHASLHDRRTLFSSIEHSLELLGPRHHEIIRRMLAAAARVRAQGRRPFLAFPSLAHPSAVAASARGFLEMIQQLPESADARPRAVFISAASGTTLAGFLIAENALRNQGHPPIPIFGVQVHPGPIKIGVRGLIRWTERFFGLTGRVPADRIKIITTELHGGFGKYPQELADLCYQVGSKLNLRIDPFFGGKTWSAMETCLSDKRQMELGPVLYWHCGYTPDWHSLGNVFRNTEKCSA